MRVGLLSDTHGFLDDAVFTHFAGCDEIWHAGDFGSMELLKRLRQFKNLRGVYGNIDGNGLRSELPLDLEWESGGIRVYMTHIGGHPGRYDAAAKKELVRRKPGLFICGHSHVLRISRDLSLGLIYMNPGACGHQGWHSIRTLIRFTLGNGEISNTEVIELGPRGRNKVV